ncbi:zinc finger CCCH domain-containing protein 1 [Senna tora]|uniref:Zinc finger CCCH domain-containing protein 1 n=1 Tax=Senna tora TaxID=362788 RepID=A0A834SDA6_9FABA|nr:zinc finger CCCH domain-containing protein 1 [Senna tora]
MAEPEKTVKSVDNHQPMQESSNEGVRGSGDIRVSARFDYVRDMCKEYKESGDCRYGDSCVFRKAINKKNFRKRIMNNDEDDHGGSETESRMMKSERKSMKADNKLFFSSKSSTSSGRQDEFDQFFQSSKEIQVEDDRRATRMLETETEFSREARADKLKKRKGTNEKLYEGIKNYTNYKDDGSHHGPLRASPYIRVSVRIDHQLDICKDYKETGYCGYGDSCKFMHDRTDYKSARHLEKEWDEAHKAKRMRSR